MNYKQLTEKKKVEIDILLAQGLSMREVGRRLKISHSTISRYKANIYQKRKIDINKEVINIKKKNYSKQSRNILANNIIYYRLKLNWSQEDLAEELGTTATYISNLENAKRNMRVDYIGFIADTLKVKVEELFIEREPVKNHRRPRK